MTLGRGTSRSLGLTVSTTNCVGLRHEPYKYRFGLIYDYLIEYATGNDGEEMGPDLLGVENAVAYGVASALDECNQDESPLYAVGLASRHKELKDGKCDMVTSLVHFTTFLTPNNNVPFANRLLRPC